MISYWDMFISDQIKAISPENRPQTTVAEIMSPCTPEITIETNKSVTESA